jgi:hypothetical protein
MIEIDTQISIFLMLVLNANYFINLILALILTSIGSTLLQSYTNKKDLLHCQSMSYSCLFSVIPILTTFINYSTLYWESIQIYRDYYFAFAHFFFSIVLYFVYINGGFSQYRHKVSSIGFGLAFHFYLGISIIIVIDLLDRK